MVLLLDLPHLVERHDRAAESPGQRAGALDDLLQDNADVEAHADPQDGGAELGDAIPQRLVLPPQFLRPLHSPPPFRIPDQASVPRPQALARSRSRVGDASGSAGANNSEWGKEFIGLSGNKGQLSDWIHCLAVCSSAAFLYSEMRDDFQRRLAKNSKPG